MNDYDDYFIREKSGEHPIGYPPSAIIRKALENLYTSIVGALDLGDFDTFLKESADLTFSEARDKMLREYGTPKELSEARLRAKTAEAALKLETAEQETRAEQRTLEQEFAELDEVARERLGENLEMSRRNEGLERELKRLREELAKAKAAPPPAAAPPGVPAPPVPAPAAPPAAHGSMYEEYKRLISQVVTIADINDLANEIFEILERKEFDKLTMQDIAEMRDELRRAAESRAIKLAEMRLPGARPKISRVPVSEREEELPRRKRERREVPAYPIPSGKVQVVHVYTRPDTEIFTSMGEEYIRDFELENTIKINRLLTFPDHWYTLSPWGKREVYGWDLATAMREAVQHLHKFSWDSLIHDYGIPAEYIDAWRALGTASR